MGIKGIKKANCYTCNKAMNAKISLEKKDDITVFNHLYCPMWNFFREKGRILCEDVYIPAAEAMAKEICKDLKVEVLGNPDEDHHKE